MIRQVIFLLVTLFSFSILTSSQTSPCSNDGPVKCEESTIGSAINNPINSLGDRYYPPPPKPDDRTFVLNEGSGLDTGCSSGELIITVPINRVISKVAPGEFPGSGENSYAENIEKMQRLGYLFKLKLQMPVYDVDYNEGERDEVYFNNNNLNSYLKGSNESWSMYSAEVPIEIVNFGKLTAGGNDAATPQDNVIKIKISVTGGGWCTSVAWVSLSVDVMSPIVFIHGNSSDGEFLRRRGMKENYKFHGLILEDSLNMLPSSDFVERNAEKVRAHLQKVARAYGVDSVHIIAHSKGGLDARAYMAGKYISEDGKKPKIISFTTLSTPHNGSILADEAVKDLQAAEVTADINWNGDFPNYTQRVIQFNRKKVTDGQRNLTTDFLRDFNFDSGNINKISGLTNFFTVGANADLDGDFKVCSPPFLNTCRFPLLQEDTALFAENFTSDTIPDFFPSFALPNLMYQNLRRVTKFDAIYSTKQVTDTDENGQTQTRNVMVVDLNGTIIDTQNGLDNDVLVTVPSAFGEGSFDRLVTPNHRLVIGANHATVGSSESFSSIVPWQYGEELLNGDLKRR